MNLENPIRLLVVGCGSRGECYASYALKYPHRAKVIGFAEPREYSRNKFLRVYQDTIDSQKIFQDWKEITRLPDRIADCVIIALPDKLHVDAAVEFTKKGYHMLLEKPMATSLEDCIKITKECRNQPNQINAVCHVLRYYPPCIKLKELMDSGILGKIVHIDHTEPVGYEHFAHSFVRGNWSNEANSSFSLLAKCCHDVDLIVNWFGDNKCKKVSSFGSLYYFNELNAPKNSTEKCCDCPCNDCPYSAIKIYKNSYTSVENWPISVVLSSEIHNILGPMTDIEDIISNKTEKDKQKLLDECLRHEKTKYGKCVFKMNNDVCDHQIVNFEFESGATASLNMIAFSKDLCDRKTKIYGTLGSLEFDSSVNSNEIIYFDFRTKKSSVIDCSDSVPLKIERIETNQTENKAIKLNGHGGSDRWLMESFIEAVIKNDKLLVLTDVEDSFRSHLIVFAAEYSRIHSKVVNINEFCLENKVYT